MSTTVSYGLDQRRCGKNTEYYAWRKEADEPTWWTTALTPAQREIVLSDPAKVFTNWWEKGLFVALDGPTCPLVKTIGGARVIDEAPESEYIAPKSLESEQKVEYSTLQPRPQWNSIDPSTLDLSSDFWAE